jgi:hypothetical protein
MRFTVQPPPPEPDDHPDVMHIGGNDRGRRLRSAAQLAAAVLAVGGVLVGFFVWFGATVGWSVVLVAAMIGYMAAMARWAGGDRH